MAVRKFPKLFKRTATGAIQEWLVSVEGTTIVTHYGQVGGKIQSTRDSIKSGKNQGRKNETDRETQAEKEAESHWLKKKKAGYVENLKDAESGKTDAVIEGGILPMLAKVYEEHIDKIKFPLAVQPKLDGHRCIAAIDGKGKVSLWTRTRKRVTSVPHIIFKLEELAEKLKLKNIFLDGELYAHRYKDDFEKITSLTRKKNASVEAIAIQYHVYDIVSDKGFNERFQDLAELFKDVDGCLELVDTVFVKNQEHIQQCFRDFKSDGYEGIMVRLFGIGYENKRTHQLLKVKDFLDDEFEIVGVEEGRGKLIGHAGAFVCKIGDTTFKAKMSGETEKLKEYWENREDYIGDMLTVQYQGLTKDGIPRFPVGLRIQVCL